MTQTAGGNPNGEFVAIGGPGDIYRLELASGELQLASMGVGFMTGSLRENLPLDIDDAGNVAFYSFTDPVRRNPDRSLELWLAEFDVAPTFSVGAESPTVLRWDPYPWALSYDVIRGDLVGPGSWGLGSGSAERAPSGGECSVPP